MAKKTYSEKLKDPRWQKKRLEILNRDDWTCQSCYDKDSTLHVHHIAYSKGEPWKTENKLLITLCENCHEYESETLPKLSYDTIRVMREAGCLSGDFMKIGEIFLGLNRDFFNFEPNLDILNYAIQSPEVWKFAHDSFFNSLKKVIVEDENSNQVEPF